jgi:hypothetical protein
MTNPSMSFRCTDFVHVRDVILANARSNRLRKLDGHVWRPVPGCPCAYERAEDYKTFANTVLKNDSVYLSNPRRHNQILQFLKKINPDEMEDVVYDSNLMSFGDGVLFLAEQRFVPYASEDFQDEFQRHRLGHNKIARHHINLPYNSKEVTLPKGGSHIRDPRDATEIF